MSWLDFAVLALAANAVVRAWLHEGGLFEELRDWLTTWITPVAAPSWSAWLREKLVWLLQCPICLTYHAAFWLAALCFLPSLWLSPPWSIVVKLPLYSLAATQLALYFEGKHE